MTLYDVSSVYYADGTGPWRWETIGTLEAPSLDDAAALARLAHTGLEVIVSETHPDPSKLPPMRVVRVR
jgi:hypothetical protein